MPNWKKVVVSGSAPTLSGLTVRGPLEVSMTASSGTIPLSIKTISDLSTDTIIQVRDDGGSFDLMTFDSEGRFNMRGTSTDAEGAGYYVSQGGVSGEHARMGFVNGKAQLSIAANGAADKFKVFVNGSNTSPMVGLTGRGTLSLGTDISAATLPNEARTNTMFIKTGTAPSTAEADNIQFFAQDVNSGAGTASPTFLTEDGTTIQLGTTSTLANVTATTFVKSGGTSAQFLKADGSVDSSTYLTSVGTINLASGVTGTLPVANGGTGAINAGDARTSLGVDPAGTVNYTLPTAASNTLGGVKIGSGISISSGVISADNNGTITSVTGTAPIVSSGGTAPAISISAATNSAAGSMSAIDKGKIDAITVTSGVNLNTMNSSISTNNSNISLKAASGANSDITSLSGLTTALSPSQGGTGATALDDIALSSFDDDLSYVDLVNAQTISGTKTFSVAQRFATGTVSAPSISFNSNNAYTTGFYLSNPHELSISRVGVQNFKFDSNGFQQLIAGGTSNFAGHLQAHCLGIGGTPSTTSGEIWAYGDVVANKSSDRRLKKYIKNIKNPLDKLSKINGVTFEWKKADEKMKKEVHSHEGPDVGVIAQEIEEVLPEIVATRDNGYKAVYYEKLVPLLIEAVKELKAEVDELKKSK